MNEECLLIIVCVNVPNESWGLVFLVLSQDEKLDLAKGFIILLFFKLHYATHSFI